MKRMISLLLLLLCVSLLAASFASAAMPMVTDDANLLSGSQRASLEAMLQQLSDTYSAQIAVVTVDSAEGYNMNSLVEYIYDTNDYGYGTGNDGVLLLIAMDVREFRILSNGFPGEAIGNYEIDAISDEITPALSAGDYADAFEIFAAECESYLEGYLYGYPFDLSTNLLIAVVIGVVISLIVVLILKGQLKTVKLQKHANSYIRGGSFNLTQNGDYFMYRNVTRTAIPQDDSSNGGSHSGGGSRHVGGGRF